MVRKPNLIPLLILAAATLAVYLLAFLLQTRISALPPGFPAEELAYPARVGNILVESPERLRFVAEGTSPGQGLTIADAAGTTHHPVTVPRRDLANLIVIGINGLFFWSVTTFIFAPRLDRPGAKSFFWIALLYGLSVMIGGIYFPGHRSWVSYAMGYLQVTILAVLPLLFVHLSLTFPYRSGFLDRARWMMPLLAVAAVAVAAWQIVAFQRYFMNPGPATGALLDAPQIAADGVLVAETVAGVAILSTRGFRSDDMLIRRQIYWILLGFTVGSAPYVFLRTLPSIFGVAVPIPSYIDRIFELAIPTSFVFVVVRHRFLDIDIILRRGLMYTVLAGVGILLYLLLGIAIGGYLEDRVFGGAGILLVMVGLAAGLAFRPLRRWIGFRVDRTFFKLTHDYDRARQEMRSALAAFGGQEELARAVARRIAHTMHVSLVSVVLREGQEQHVAGGLPSAVAIEAFRECESREGCGTSTFAASGTTSAPDRENDDFPEVLLKSGIVVVTPVRHERGLMGLIMLGRRTTQRRYIDRDLEFLDACADVVSGALARIELVQAVSAESFERRRLDELNRHKTEYLSHVSHDLRTPLSSIVWASQNLADGVVGELNAEQLSYIQSIRISSGHLSQLVANLVAVSQIDHLRGTPDLEAVGLPETLNEITTMMKPLALQDAVTFAIRTDQDPLVAAGYPPYLREVITNLLDNAVRFSPPESDVEIEVQGDGDRHVVLTVRDHGPGIEEALLGTIFDRHTQGKRSPYASRRGFGLGLHIVKSYAEQMGGTVEARNHPDGGALFTLRLSRWTGAKEGDE